MPDTNADDDIARYVCLECSYIYDPQKGDSTQGVPPGTPFRKLPPTWRCRECKILITKAGVFKKVVEKPSEKKDPKKTRRS